MHRSSLSLFRKPEFFHIFSVLFVLWNYRKCMEELGPASMQNNWSKSKRLHKESQFNSRDIGWNTFMAAVLFFWNFNMAAVKSCQNALYNDHHLHIYAYIPVSLSFITFPFLVNVLLVTGLDPTSFVATSWNSYSVEHSVSIFWLLVFFPVIFSLVHSFSPFGL